MQMISGQSRLAPFGLSFLGLEELGKGDQSVTASYDYHIGVDYHKSYQSVISSPLSVKAMIHVPAFRESQLLDPDH